MKTFTLLLPLVAAAMSCSAKRSSDNLCASKGDNLGPNPSSYDVVCLQTQDDPINQLQGGLGNSVSGHFTGMSNKKIGMGCGLNWKEGQLYGGFDGGDPDNGVGGGFEWKPHSLGSNLGVRFKNTVINLNVTITEQNKVLFTVNKQALDWDKVLQQRLPEKDNEYGEGYNGEVVVGAYDRKPVKSGVKPEILP